MLEDLRFAYRNLARTPGFWILSVLILGLGVGANATMYSTIRGLILAPIETVLRGEYLVMAADNREQGRENSRLSRPELMDLREQSRLLEDVVGVRMAALTISGSGEAERLTGSSVTPGFLRAIGAEMEIGRDLASGEFQPGKSQVVVLHRRFWKRKFGGDPGIIGRSIQLDGTPYTVVGVAREDVWFPYREGQFWTPVEMTRGSTNERAQRDLRVLAKLRPGVTIEQADAEIQSISRRWSEEYPDSSRGWTHELRTAYQGMVTSQDRTAVLLVYLVAAGVLMIACANVANLLLARAVTRQREMALRLALGADRWRLLRLSLIENLLLAVPAAVAAVLASAWAGRLLVRSFNSNSNMYASEQVIDVPVVLFTLAIALGSTLFFGILPAWRSWRPDLTHALKEGGTRAGTGRSSRRIAGSFVVAQVAVALALLCFSGLLLRSMVALHSIDPGFETRNLAMVQASAQLWKHKEPAQIRQYFEEMARRIAAVPGVRSASIIYGVPQVETDGRPTALVIEGQTADRESDAPSGDYLAAGPGALETLGIPLLSGRAIAASDTADSPKVAIVNQTMARRFWNGDAIGKRFQIAALGKDWVTVAGVASDVKPANLVRAPWPQMFVPFAQSPERSPTLIARTAGEDGAVLPAVRQAVRIFDPDQPAKFTTARQEAYRDLRGGRTLAALVAAFGGLALGLSGVGLFALLLHSVRQRLPEIGIRMALGADSGHVRGLVFGHAARLVAIGFGIGSILAFGLAKLAVRILFSLARLDAVTVGSATAMLAFVTLIACWLPARLAASADPASVLKAE